MTSEQGGLHSDAFLTGMHLALITSDRFCTNLAQTKLMSRYSPQRLSESMKCIKTWTLVQTLVLTFRCENTPSVMTFAPLHLFTQW